ncbi:MAG: hypothetical protein ACR2KQ_12245 [Actinomycetota bacterium]
MTRRKRITHDDAEALLSGRASDHPEVAGVLEALHSGWSGPSEDRGPQHMTAIHEAAVRHAHDGGPAATASPLATAAATSRRRLLLNRSRAVAFRLSSIVVALSAATMGLAHAGVDLPGNAAEKAFSVVGIELPNQSSETSKSVAEDVRAAREGTEPGCKRGRAVATAASQNRQDEPKDRKDPCTKDERSSENGSARGGKATGEEKSSQGKEKATTGKAEAEENKNSAPGHPASPPATQAERRNDNAERPDRDQGERRDNSTGNDNGKGAKAHTDRIEELTSEQAPSIGTSSTNKG